MIMATTFERYRRLPEDAPARALTHVDSVGTWSLSARSFSRSLPTPAKFTEMRLPHHHPPWSSPPGLEISTMEGFRKSDEKSTNLNEALRALGDLPPASASLYTDASYFCDKSGNYHCGSAAVLFAEGLSICLLERYDPALMIYNAEQQAILSALQLVKSFADVLPPGRLRIITDSQSSLRSLNKGQLRQSSAVNARILDEIKDSGRPFSLQFVPSHCGVVGNEIADVFAGRAARAVDIPIKNVPFDFRMAQCSIRNQSMRLWLGMRGHQHVHSLATGGGKRQRFHPTLSRKEEMEVARLRSGHHRLVKQPRLGLINCIFCGKRNTDTVHLLELCPFTAEVVAKHFPHTRPPPDPGERNAALQRFFQTDAQPTLICLLRSLEVHLHLSPLRAAIPRQRFVEYLIAYSKLGSLESSTIPEVQKFIDVAYSTNNMSVLRDALHNISLYCFYGTDNEPNFEAFRSKVSASKARILPEWLQMSKGVKVPFSGPSPVT
eukprot:TRINITY_DN169_c1_g1_i1.p1 TRINITY_DN169_c1_g1~~TRINITY_DN169_c1_g1_i1.p1  ORF type:complete len:493 (+),score=-2.62 TRINITY_DN169_c1_g1_i1:172-1650(+)